jgi:hypothetical protein
MTDITAIVLTIGEETTERAIDSLRRQTVLPEQIIVIRNVTPFHKALNVGVSKVKTEFFIQVDADMVLDENCLEDLRQCMTEGVGIAMGQLRDPLMGIESGIKMFRKKCFERVRFKDSISPDTDFYRDLEKCGWSIRYALNSGHNGRLKELWHTFGEHHPNYTPLFTYRRYHLLGRRYRYRRDLDTFKRRLRNVQNSGQSVALVAQIAMSHGIFSEDEIDLLMPSLYRSNEDFSFLERFLRSENTHDVEEPKILSLLASKPQTIYRNSYKLGTDLRRTNSSAALKYCIDILSKSKNNFAWIAKVGLCHGIFSEAYGEERARKEYDMVKELL